MPVAPLPGVHAETSVPPPGWHLEGGIERCAQALDPAGFTDARAAHLLSLERDHFWFPPRLALLANRLAALAPPGQALIELGCGTGAFAAHAADAGYRVTAVDAHLPLLAIARQRHPSMRLIQADVARPLPLPDGAFSVCACLDVLEHVEARSLLAEAHRLLAPRGALLLSVPAHSFLWSALDEEAGHRCRYSLAMLKAELGSAGFVLEGFTHYQMLLLPLLLASRRMLKARTGSFERRPSPWLGRLLGGINRFEVERLGRFQLPVGSSLIAWARRAA